MKDILQTSSKGKLKYTVILIAYSLGVNLLLPRAVGLMGWPIYLDSVGTVGAAALGGFLPGIITAFGTNLLNSFFDGISIYYTIISILIAVAAAWFSYKDRLKGVTGIIRLILVLTCIGGLLGGLVTWFLSGPGTDPFSEGARQWLTGTIGTGTFGGHMIVTIVMDLLDKAITVTVVVIVIRFLPRDTWDYTWLRGWRQTPMPPEEQAQMRRMKFRSISLGRKLALLLVLTSLSVAVSLTWVSYTLFSDYTHERKIHEAETTAKLAAAVIDPEMVDEYLTKGKDAPGYRDTEALLYDLRDSSSDIEYLYVYQIREDGCHVVFDLDTEELAGAEPGDLVPFDESFEHLLPALLAGQPIDPIETNDTYGWLLTVYQPVYDAGDNCVCYAATDVSMHSIVDYEMSFMIRLILMFLGFFFLFFSIALYLARYHIIMPINSMSFRARAFEAVKDDEMTIEDGVEELKSLKIDTGEEVENLYQSLCQMAEDLITRMNNMRKQTETINEMQRGLILVMADMVESRDSNTGEHIHKTAAYTRIIIEGLKRKGYYSDQLTDKFISDVENSAPLHDVGKINVSDVILNKPGRFTDEEYAIMKSHAEAGRHILEQATSKVRGESYLTEAINMAGCHHEKWDGTGYPDGLKGEEIPLSARIMAIADVFDALVSKRVYKEPMPFERAVDIIRKDAGTHFDPKCVDAFLDSLDEVREVHEKLMGTALEDI